MAVAMALALTGAIGAAAASAEETSLFTAEEYPAFVSSDTTLQYFLFKHGEYISCESSSLEESHILDATETVTFEPSYENCNMGNYPGTVAVDADGCQYEFHAGGPSEEYGSLYIANCNGPGIDLHWSGFDLGPGCHYTILADQVLDVGYKVLGSGSEREVKIYINTSELKLSADGSPCGTGQFEVNYSGAWEVTGSTEAEEQQGFFLTDEEAPTRVAAEDYPASLAGGGFDSFEVFSSMEVPGTFDCGEATVEETLPFASPSLALEAQYGECTFIEGFFPVKVEMNSCRYDLHVQDSESPYSGELDISCEKKGDAIEYKTYKYGSGGEGEVICLIEVGPQEGLTGIDLTTVGEGSERGIGFEAEISGVEYDLLGGGLCATEERSDSVLSGEGTLLGVDESEQQVGVYIDG